MNKPSTKEVISILLSLAVFLGVNLWTSTRFPIPWLDEVLFVDPAANLYFNNSFTTTANGWERATDFHAFHPLYSLLLAGWFEVTGFGLIHARALNYVLVILTALTIWFTVARIGLVTSATYRLFLILLLLFGYSISFPYRTGRVEPLMMFLAAVSFLMFTTKNRKWRLALMGACALFFAPAGLQFVAFAGVLTFLLLLYLRQQVLNEVVVVWVALLISVTGLFSLYISMGAWENALATVFSTTASGGIAAISSGGGLHQHNRIPKDPSLMILLSVLGVLLIYHMRHGQIRWRSMLSFGLVFSITVPVVLLLLAKFPTYYSWMVFIPLAICVCSIMSWMKAGRLTTLGLRAGLVLVVASGLPLQLLAVTYDWRDRDYDLVHAIVSANIEEKDWVLCDYQAYFAVKPTAVKVFLPDYVNRLTTEEKRKVTLLIGSDAAVTQWRSILGGEWAINPQRIVPERVTILERLIGKDTGVGLIKEKYHLTIHRRQA